MAKEPLPALASAAAELERAQADARASASDTRALVKAQRSQIAEHEREWSALTTALEADQRLFSAQGSKAGQAQRLRQELKAVQAELVEESDRVAALAEKTEQLKQTVRGLQKQTADAGSSQLRERKLVKRAEVLQAKLVRTQTGCDEAAMAGHKLRAEIESLRRERQMFETKLQVPSMAS